MMMLSAEDDAAAAIFIDLCRASPLLRGWLLQEFGRSESVRSRFAQLLEEAGPSSRPGAVLPELAGQRRGYALEKARLKERFAAGIGDAQHGGLSRLDIERLIRRYQAGRIDGGAFLLAYAWRRQAANGATVPPQLLRASSAFLAEATQPGRAGLLADLARALAFLDNHRIGEIGRATFGYAKWWKLSILLYLLNHPKKRYRVREFRDHLAGQKLRVDATDIRKFCKRHGIARDPRAGRPKTASAR